MINKLVKLLQYCTCTVLYMYIITQFCTDTVNESACAADSHYKIPNIILYNNTEYQLARDLCICFTVLNLTSSFTINKGVQWSMCSIQTDSLARIA